MTLEPAPAHRVADDSGPPGPPLVSFVVVNWKNEEATRQCVASIVAQDAGVPIEVIVVDNESDGPPRHYGEDVLVANRTNRGFAAGFNDGLREAKGTFVAAVNNDCQLAGQWLREGLSVLGEPLVGIVGGREMLWDETHAVGDRTSPARTYVTVDPLLGTTRLGSEQVGAVIPVASLNGSNLLARKDLLDRLGGFAEEFFTYYEDADLCARARALGTELRFCPEMAIWHRGGLSSSRRPLKREYLARRNQLLFVARHFPERSWRRIVMRNLREYVSAGLTGSSGGLAAARRGHALLGRTQRLACLEVVAWATLSWRTLERSRRIVVRCGQHDDDYVTKIAELALQVGS